MSDLGAGERIEPSRKPIKCPACGAKAVARILYGMPIFSEELEEELREGKITLGGCCVSDDDPNWECTSCSQLLWRKSK